MEHFLFSVHSAHIVINALLGSGKFVTSEKNTVLPLRLPDCVV